MWKIDNIAKLASCAKKGVREMKIDSLDGGQDGEYSGIDFLKISKTFATQGDFFFGPEQFDRVQQTYTRM